MQRLSVNALDPGAGVDGEGIVVSGGRFVVGTLPSGGGGGTGGIATQRLHLRRTTDQALTASAENFVSWDLEKADAWAGFAASTSGTDIRVDETGLYVAYLRVPASGAIALSLYDVTTAEHLLYRSSGESQGPMSGPAFMDATHVYRVRVYTGIGSTTLTGGDSGTALNFMLAKMKG